MVSLIEHTPYQFKRKGLAGLATAVLRAAPPTNASPNIWVLADDRPGHTTQAVGLACALGWPYQLKVVHFSPLNRIGNRLLGASSVSLRRSSLPSLTPPWPDLVIAMGRRTAPIARWIRKRSGGQTRLIQLGRKGANNPDPFDLTIVCRHFQFPFHPKRAEVLLPFTRVTEQELAAARRRWPDLFREKSRPRVSLLVGGSTSQHRLTADSAASMARDVAGYVAALGGSLSVVTSRRTGPAVTAAIQKEIPDGTALYAWQPDDPNNPYLGYLATSDVLVVTGESESMLAEAAATGKAVVIFPLPKRRPGPKGIFAKFVTNTAHSNQARIAAGICIWLLRRGLVIPSRDLDLLHRGMVNAGMASIFGGIKSPRLPIEATDELDKLVSRVAGLFAAKPPQRRQAAS